MEITDDSIYNRLLEGSINAIPYVADLAKRYKAKLFYHPYNTGCRKITEW